MYGNGIYFAKNSTKAAQYSTNDFGEMLICSVAVGKAKVVESAQSSLNYTAICNEFDSVYAPRDTKGTGGVLFDEFIVYNVHQILPKYLIVFHKEKQM